MKNIFKAFASIAIAAFSLASCDIFPTSSEAELLADTVSVSNPVLTLAATGAEASFTVTSQGDWIIIPGDADWLSFTPSRGNGVQTISVRALDNVDEVYGEVQGPRSASITVAGTGVEVPVTINQDGEAGLDASRLYKKVTSAADFDVAKSFLLVADDGSALQMAKAFDASSESTYSYLNPMAVTATDDVITLPNATYACKFMPAAEEGYYLQMPNGRMLFQSASYNNFYSTTDEAKADAWSVTFDESGHAILTNLAVDKTMQYSVSYGSYGAYGSMQSGAVYPFIYQDSAAPITETLTIDESATTVAANATSALIPVTASGNWKVRCHDSWVKAFTRDGKGNGQIEMFFDKNSSEKDAKTATVMLLGETTSITFTLTQNKMETTVKGILSQITSTDKNKQSSYYAELKGAVVSYVNGGNVFIEDETAGILLYLNNSGLKAGDKISGPVYGTGYLYSKLPEIVSLGNEYVKGTAAIPLTTVTIAELLADYNKYLSKRILIEGVTVTKTCKGSSTNSDRQGEITQNGKSLMLYSQLKSGIAVPKGSEGNVICYPTLYNTTKELGFWQNSDFEYTKGVTELSVSASVSVNVGKTAKIEAVANSGATLTFKSADESIATVAADGTVTGVGEGSTTITVTSPAFGIFPAAEATCSVEVVGDPRILFTSKCLPTAYANDAEVTADGVKFCANQVANYGNGIQFKKAVGYVYNKAAIGKKILKIVLTPQSGKTYYPTNIVVCGGTEANPSTVVPAISEAGLEFDFSDKNYTFFKIQDTSNYAVYLASIKIVYED